MEKLHRTLLGELFRIQGRKKWYNTVEEMQADLGRYLKHYNNERTHRGLNMNGRTPCKAFIDGLPKPKKEEVKESK